MRIALARWLFRLLTRQTPQEYAIEHFDPGLPGSDARRRLPYERWKFAAWLLGTVAAVTIALLGYGVLLQTLTLSHTAYLIMLIAVFTISFVLFIRGMEIENRLSIESNWGGLGGGLGGWRVSSTITFLLTSSALFGLLVTAVSADPPTPDLRERYRAAINLAEREGIHFQIQSIIGRKLHLKGTSPSQPVANDFWNQVKLTNPVYDDIVIELTGGGAPSSETSQPKHDPASSAQPNVSPRTPSGGAGASDPIKPADNPASSIPSGTRPATQRPSDSSPAK